MFQYCCRIRIIERFEVRAEDTHTSKNFTFVKYLIVSVSSRLRIDSKIVFENCANKIRSFDAAIELMKFGAFRLIFYFIYIITIKNAAMASKRTNQNQNSGNHWTSNKKARKEDFNDFKQPSRPLGRSSFAFIRLRSIA